MHTKTSYQRLGFIFALSVFLASFCLSVWTSTTPASAVIVGPGTSAHWIDYYHIGLGSFTFQDYPSHDQWIDPTSQQTFTVFTYNSCNAAILFNSDPTTAQNALYVSSGTGGGYVGGSGSPSPCVWNISSAKTVLMDTRPKLSTTVWWTSQSPPQVSYNGNTYDGSNGISGNNITLSYQSIATDPQYPCVFTIGINNYKTTQAGQPATLHPSTPKNPNTLPGGILDSGCVSGAPQRIYLSNTFATAGQEPSPGTPGGPNGTSTSDACPIADDEGFRWVLCPIFTLGTNALKFISGVMEGLLYTHTSYIFNASFYNTFRNFRDIGVAILIIAGLVMVVSQAAGLEIFAAYTVRKALPRVVIAAIGMTLAWSVLQFAVTFFDDLGSWAQQLIVTAGGLPAGSSLSSTYNTVTGAAIGIVGGIAAVAFSAGIVMSLLGTLLLAFLVGFIVLTLRQLVILICIITAPLAIAAWVLPGTKRVWDIWMDAFQSVMLVFPVIMAFLGAGMAMSYIAGQEASASGGDHSLELLSLGSLIAPLFLLPFAFSLVGGVMSAAHSLVNNQHKGAFARLSKFRQNKATQRWQAAKTGNFWREGSFGKGRVGRTADWFARGGSRRMQGAALRTIEPMGKGRREALRSTIGADVAFEAMEKNSDFRNIKDNDTLLWAGLAGRGTEADARSYLSAQGQSGSLLEENVGAVMRAKRALGEDNFRVAATIAQAGTGTGYASSAQMLNAIADNSKGNSALAMRMLGASRSAANQSGRHDLGGAGFGFMSTRLNDALNGRKLDDSDTQAMSIDAFENNDAVTISRGRAQSVRRITGDVAKHVTDLNSDSELAAARTELNNLFAQRNAIMTGSIPPLPPDQQAIQQARLEQLNADPRLHELGRLAQDLSNFQSTASVYAAPSRVSAASDATNQTVPIREQIRREEASYSPPPSPGISIGLPNRAPAQVEGMKEQRQTRGYNPDDPNAPKP